jgi:Niemann-Pick C1 protein
LCFQCKLLNRIYIIEFFLSIGYFCASRPILVLIIGALFCVALSGGFYFFDVITDPVELWSPADSNTRLNKNYYDTHFRPFYRTTQMIIRATNQTPWQHQLDPFYQNDPIQYSSIFEREFLEQVLKLQNDISALVGVLDCDATFTDKCDNSTRFVNITLKDICFAPLKVEYLLL